MVHTGWRGIFLCLRHISSASAIRHGAILQPPLRAAAVLHRPVSAGILSRTGKGYRKSGCPKKSTIPLKGWLEW